MLYCMRHSKMQIYDFNIKKFQVPKEFNKQKEKKTIYNQAHIKIEK